MTRRRTRVVAGTLIVMVIVGLLSVIAILRVDDIGNQIAPPLEATQAGRQVDVLSSEERAFYDQIAQKLRIATAESLRLAELGEARSRDVPELITRADRLTAALDSADAAIGRSVPPPRFRDAMDLYRQAGANLRQSMHAARSALLSFDFAALGVAVDEFALGAGEMDDATRTLEVSAGMATPVSSPFATTSG